MPTAPASCLFLLLHAVTSVAESTRQENLRSARNRLAEISSHIRAMQIGPRSVKLSAHVQRIEIGPTKVTLVLRLPTETSKRPLDPIMVTSSRAWKLPANANGLAQCLQVRRTARKSLDC